eukprot:jgi/Undpi1/4100/HiC_scaffold_16.g07467.m1
MISLRVHPNKSAHPAPPATREEARGSERATSKDGNPDGGQQGSEGDISSGVMGFGPMGIFSEMEVLIKMPDHPHINQAVGINDTGQSNFWLVYPLADGDLLEDIAKRTKMIESEVMRLIIEGGTGASFMHDNGYVHNDIKAENILVFSSGPGTKTTGKIADLGLARADDKRRLVAMDAESARSYIEYITIRNLTEPSFRSAVLNPSIVSAQFQHMSNELIELIDPALAANPSERPTMQHLLRGMIGLYGRQLKFEKASSADVAAAAAATVSGALPATDTLETGATAVLSGVDPAPEETARVRRLPPGLFCSGGGVVGGGGDGGAGGREDGGTSLGSLPRGPADHTADGIQYGTASVRRPPPGLLVVDSGGASFPAPNAAATAAAITTTTATVTVDRGDGAVRYSIPEGNVVTPVGMGGAVDDTGEGAGCSYDGGGAYVDGYAVRGPAPKPAVARVTEEVTPGATYVDGGSATSGAATGHLGFPRLAPAPHVNVPPPPTPLVGRKAGGILEVMQAGSSTPHQETRGNGGSSTCRNTFGGGGGDGDEGGYVTPSTVFWMEDGGKEENATGKEEDGVSEKDQDRVEEEKRLPAPDPQETAGGGEKKEATEEGVGVEGKRRFPVLVAQDMGVGEKKGEATVEKEEVYGKEGTGRPTLLATRDQPPALPAAATTTTTTATITKKIRPMGTPYTYLDIPQRGNESSGDSPRHHQRSAFRETGAFHRPAHQGCVAPALAVTRAPPMVAAGGGGNVSGRYGDGVDVSGSEWRGDARYFPVSPSAARQVACSNGGRYALGVPSQRPVAACGSFAHQATVVSGADYYPPQAGHRGQGWYGGQPAFAFRVEPWRAAVGCVMDVERSSVTSDSSV